MGAVAIRHREGLMVGMGAWGYAGMGAGGMGAWGLGGTWWAWGHALPTWSMPYRYKGTACLTDCRLYWYSTTAGAGLFGSEYGLYEVC
jgi:hypothetical protein